MVLLGAAGGGADFALPSGDRPAGSEPLRFQHVQQNDCQLGPTVRFGGRAGQGVGGRLIDASLRPWGARLSLVLAQMRGSSEPDLLARAERA